MNEFELLLSKLIKEFPNTSVCVDPPAKETGKWFLNITLGEKLIILMWQSGKGFSISLMSSSHFYGEKSGELCSTSDEAIAILKKLGANH